MKGNTEVTEANHTPQGRTAADLVTETDKSVEDMVSSTLREKYPDYE